MENRVICGNAKTELAKLPKESVSCCVTSPPYYFMRSYNTEPIIWDGDGNCEHEWATIRTPDPNGSGGKTDFIKNTHARKDKDNISEYVDYNDRAVYNNMCIKCHAVRCELGQEPTVDLFVAHLVQIFDEVYRVLRKDGVLFVNLADKYGGSGNGSWNAPIEIRGKQYRKTKQNVDQEFLAPALPQNKSAKSLLLIPERFAISMCDHGWILRNKNVWYKTNAMPESCKDRFSRSWEYVYMFTKSKAYYFEQQFEALSESTPARMLRAVSKDNKFVNFENSAHGLSRPRPNVKLKNTGYGGDGKGLHHSGYFDHNGSPRFYPLGRNKRDVFIQATRPTKIKHFASYPIELISPLISAGCPEFICKNCNKPRRKVFNKQRIDTRPGENVLHAKSGNEGDPNVTFHKSDYSTKRQKDIVTDFEWKECGCDNPDYESGVVLDPFGGICTTAIAAKRLNRGYITIDLNPEYCEWGKERIEKEGVLKPKRKTKAERLAEFERELEDRQLEMF